MRKRVAHRLETAAQVARELLGRELSGGIERPIEGPVVEVDQGLEVFERHGRSLYVRKPQVTSHDALVTCRSCGFLAPTVCDDRLPTIDCRRTIYDARTVTKIS